MYLNQARPLVSSQGCMFMWPNFQGLGGGLMNSFYGDKSQLWLNRNYDLFELILIMLQQLFKRIISYQVMKLIFKVLLEQLWRINQLISFIFQFQALLIYLITKLDIQIKSLRKIIIILITMLPLKVFILLALIALSQVREFESKVCDIDTLLKNITAFQSATEPTLISMEKPTSANIVIGDFGSGKDTFIKFMIGSPMYIVKEEDGTFTITSHDYEAKDLPKTYKDREGRVWIYTPGFEDNADFRADFLGTLLMSQIFNQIQRKKIVFVVPEDRLVRTGSQWFKERLLKLRSWIGPSFGNLTIIVSKGKKNFNYRIFMEAIIELDYKLMDEEDKKYLADVIKNAIIEPFNSPLKLETPVVVGKPYVDQQGRKRIIAAIQGISFVQNLKGKNILAGDNAKVIQNLAAQIEQYYQQMFKLVQNELTPFIHNLERKKLLRLASLLQKEQEEQIKAQIKWTQKSGNANQDQIQKQIMRTSNLNNNKQFSAIVGALKIMAKKKGNYKKLKSTFQSIEQIFYKSSKLARLLQNTYLVRTNGDKQQVWIHTHYKVKHFSQNLLGKVKRTLQYNQIYYQFKHFFYNLFGKVMRMPQNDQS